MAVRASVTRFPGDPDALEVAGLPWGVTLTPFATKDENGDPPVYGSDGHLLPRCENCWAYYNTYCEQEQWAWTCALCGTLNGLPSQAIARYSLPDSCPENISSFIDLELPCNFEFTLWFVCIRVCMFVIVMYLPQFNGGTVEGSEEMQARPVYVAAVDLACKLLLRLYFHLLAVYGWFIWTSMIFCFFW